MKIQLLLLLAAVAVYCESPPRLIKPAVQPTKKPYIFPPIEMNPNSTAAKSSSFMNVAPAVNKYLKEKNPNAQLAYIPFKVLKHIIDLSNKMLETLEVEMAESTCKIDEALVIIPGKCSLSGKGVHYRFRAVIGLRYNPKVGHDQIAVFSLTNLEDKDE